MKQLPVDKCMDILDVFRAYNHKELWVNKIVDVVRKTTSSKDAPRIKDAIKILKNCQILKSTASKYHSQKQIITLTRLGEEIVNSIDILEKCISSDNELVKVIMKYCIPIEKNLDPDSNEDSIKNILLYRGWNKLEIKYYENIMTSAIKIENMYRKNIFNAILERFSNIETNHEINNITHKIIMEIMMDKIEKTYNNILRINDYRQEINFEKTTFSEFYPRTINENPFAENIPLIIDDIDEFYLVYEPVLIKEDIAKSIEEITYNLITFLQPDDDLIHDKDNDFLSNDDYNSNDLDTITNVEHDMLEQIKAQSNSDFSVSKVDRYITDLSGIKYKKIILKYLKSK